MYLIKCGGQPTGGDPATWWFGVAITTAHRKSPVMEYYNFGMT